MRHFCAIKSKTSGRQPIRRPDHGRISTLALRQARWARQPCGAGRFFATFSLIALLGLTALLCVSGIADAATTFKTLYEFQEGNDGNGPNGPLTFDAAGALYGTTINGGGTGCIFAGQVIGCGTVFKLTPSTTPGALGRRPCSTASPAAATAPSPMAA
jgi:hypothetical protein